MSKFGNKDFRKGLLLATSFLEAFGRNLPPGSSTTTTMRPLRRSARTVSIESNSGFISSGSEQEAPRLGKRRLLGKGRKSDYADAVEQTAGSRSTPALPRRS